MTRRNRAIWWTAIVAALAVVAGSLGLWLWHASAEPTYRAGTPTSSQLRAVENDIVSRDPVQVAAALDLPAGTTLSAQTLSKLSDLRPIVIDPASMRVLTRDVVTAHASVQSGSTRSNWDVTLIDKDKKWRLVISNSSGE